MGNFYSGNSRAQEPDDLDVDAIRADVRTDLAEVAAGANPVQRVLLDMGILEDMEVCRRAAMKTKVSRNVYLYLNKLTAIKQYSAIVKDAMAVNKSIPAPVVEVQEEEDEFGGVEVSIKR